MHYPLRYVALLLAPQHDCLAPSGAAILRGAGVAFGASAGIAGFVSRGKHVSWTVFAASAVAAWVGSSG